MAAGAESNGHAGSAEERDGATDETGDGHAGHAGHGGRPPLTEKQKRILAVALVVHAVVVVFTLRDLRRRPAAAVRGPKWIWGLVATLNTSGSAAYWLVGRRRDGRSSG